ncbi:MAG: hypothetical protein VX435_02910 [Planctomycetota bacterium]|nr:hypothetical protein [Planctomycetota bacterium]MEE2737149.1 hypothetical protein [Planctomycetota bacterium]
MSSKTENQNSFEWEQWYGAELVLDTSSPYVILGTLAGFTPCFLLLENADVHDLRDSQTTREQYVVDSRRHGIRINRKCVYVATREVVSVSRLKDILSD